MRAALDSLLDLLDLEELEVNIFRGRSPEGDSQRVFGGQVLGQALVAAGRTVEHGAAHSLHAYFLRPGDPSAPILYQVDRTKDGRAFTTRRVIAIQHGRVIFHLETSFHRPEEGPLHQDTMPEAPEPESLPSWHERLEPKLVHAPEEMRRWVMRPRPIDCRYVTDIDPIAPEKGPPRLLVWIRADGVLADDPLLQRCVVAYASDMTLLDVAALPHAISWVDPSYQIASLDHAMWFHHDFRADEWLLYAQDSPAAAGGRGFAMGRLFTRDGQLVVSVVQEGLMRRVAS
ncbi:MAG: acyl-CoA thioesterase [Myxococcota bacterium]